MIWKFESLCILRQFEKLINEKPRYDILIIDLLKMTITCNGL